jgi:biopolymer transport protein ExbD
MKLNVVKSVHYDSGPNMTPLVDVVMVILIFLMLAGSFGAASHYLPATPPVTGGIGKPGVAQMANLDVFVTSPSAAVFRARIGDGETFTDPAALREALTLKRRMREASGAAASEMQVTIAPRLNTRHDHVLAAYEAAMEAQWPRVGFKTARE